MLTRLDLGVASSSRSKDDQFHEPRVDEMPDMYDELFFDIGDDENNELIDNLEEHRDDNGELIDYREEGDDDEALGDDESDDDALEDDNNLFAAPEMESEDENYEGVELEDKLDIEILL
jgi:hypothetical protein